MIEKRWAWLVAGALMIAGIVPPPTTSLAHDPGTRFGERLTPEIEEGDINIRLEPLATGFDALVRGTTAPGDEGRLYVADQTGKLYAVELSSGQKTVFIDVSSRLPALGILGPDSFDERGLIGVTFHPEYASNGLLYLVITEKDDAKADFSTIPAGARPDFQTTLTEWKARDPKNPAAGVDMNSRRELFRADWPQFNHRGGDIHFGSDGMLYMSLGDGGAADDQDGQPFIAAAPLGDQSDVPTMGHQGDGNAQKLNTHHGKFFRLDVAGRNSKNGQYGVPADNPFVGRSDALPEIWAYGFRNPWRWSFDRETGDLWEGDIGQNDIEEVNVVRRGGNYGWNIKEGSPWFDFHGFEADDGEAVRENPGRAPAGFQSIDPVAQYDTHHDGHSVIGGYVYRGSAIPGLRGKFVFGDFGRIFVTRPTIQATGGRLLYLDGGRVMEFPLTSRSPIADWTLNGFGQDARGELYVMTTRRGIPAGQTGAIMRLLPAAGPPGGARITTPPPLPGPGPAGPGEAPARSGAAAPAAQPAAAAPPAQIPRQLPRTGDVGGAALVLAGLGGLLAVGGLRLRRRAK